MRCFLIGIILALGSCSDSTEDTTWTWDRWSRALLDGTAPIELPSIPVAGWEHRGEHGWFRDSAQVADYNDDGAIDYVRIQDPPGSYNHRIWVDRDYDGYFDTYPDAPARDERNPDYRVPQFEPR